MKDKKYYSLLCVALIISSTCDAHRHRDFASKHVYKDDMQNAFWGALTVVGAVTGIYAFGRWCGLWGAPSNEVLIERCRNDLSKIDGYQSLIRLAHRMQKQHGNMAYYFDEELLYELAIAKGRSRTINSLIKDIKLTITDLKSNRSAIEKRMLDLSHSEQWHEVKYVYNRMDHLVRKSKEVLFELESFYALLAEHRSYFQLFEVEDSLARDYRREFELLQRYANDQYALAKAMRSSILSKHSGAFALISFVKKLKQAIYSLEQALERSAYNYATRISYARSLLGSLYYIQEMVISDKEYIRSLAEYERAQREKERLRLERERVQTEQRIAAAKEREAYAKEREARARERQNRLKEQEMYEYRMQRQLHW
ncbi:MAG: hypothetical protein WD055_04220 [Candidatus Dependentiae bacterium]